MTHVLLIHQVASLLNEPRSTRLHAHLYLGDISHPQGGLSDGHFSPHLSSHVGLVCGSFASTFGPGPGHLTSSEEVLQVQTKDWRATIRPQTNLDEERALVVSVSLVGATEDRLRVS